MKLCPQCKTGFPDDADTCPTHGGMLSEIIDLKPGMLIRGTYRIVRKLGEGTFGTVYLAEHIEMGEPRALKFLGRQWSRDEAFVSRFRREVRALRQVRHKNVVDCGDLERAEDGSLFFSMEYVVGPKHASGPDLRDYLRSTHSPLDVTLALLLARGVAEGLGAAHDKGLVHRDIKPENILLARVAKGYIPKIADFGIVATRESGAAHTRTGSTLLTWAYAAPEQWRGTKAAELDGRTDLYALGGVLFELLTGQTVFEAEDHLGWAEQHLHTTPRKPSELRPELATWVGLDKLVLQLLAKECNDRPKDVAMVVKLIDAVRLGTKPEEEIPKNAAQEHNKRGMAHLNKGQIEAAIAEFREALRHQPSLAIAHSNLGRAYWKKGDADAAMTEYREALRLDPNLAVPHNNLGLALWKKGNRDAAVAEYRQALLLQPNLVEAHAIDGCINNAIA